jgi:hypothetical protein
MERDVMPIIPMKQKITVSRGGALDEWGNPTAGTTFELSCRIDEGSTLSKVRSEGVSKGEETIADARIILDKLADIRYTDTISFTNELGETITRQPKEINVKRGIGGKPIMSEVLI